MRFLRYALPVFVVAFATGGPASAAGLLVPEDKKLPPLAMVNHKVSVTVDEQVALTTVEQTFRNHTDRNLEATYLFPVPKGASVDKFTMWVDGKEQGGELLDAIARPQGLHRHRSPNARPRTAGVPRQQPAPAECVPGAAEGRYEGKDQLQVRCAKGRVRGRVCVPPQNRREGDADARRVLGHTQHQVAAFRSERLQPDARDHHHPQERQGSQHRVRAQSGAPR